MTDDDILRMAIECQLVTTGNREGIYSEVFMRFARMAMQHEREECAVIAETPIRGEQDDITMEAKDRVAKAIRARGTT